MPDEDDRLSKALRALEAAGIVARGGLAASIDDAETAVAAEAKRLFDEGDAIRGFCTFNRQDRGVLYLSYAAWPADPASDIVIGREVAACLHRHGFSIDWSGSADERIGVRLGAGAAL